MSFSCCIQEDGHANGDVAKPSSLPDVIHSEWLSEDRIAGELAGWDDERVISLVQIVTRTRPWISVTVQEIDPRLKLQQLGLEDMKKGVVEVDVDESAPRETNSKESLRDLAADESTTPEVEKPDAAKEAPT